MAIKPDGVVKASTIRLTANANHLNLKDKLSRYKVENGWFKMDRHNS